MTTIVFQPKEGGRPHVAELKVAEGSGYDLVLFIDRTAATPDSGWMLELGVEASGAVSGQITGHPGQDALAIFTCTRDTLRITDNGKGPTHTITATPRLTLEQRHARMLEALRCELQDMIDTQGGRAVWGMELSDPDHPYHERVKALRALIEQEEAPL
jgi:hypothetical protein